MKGVFGILLVGGGVILVAGLFAGKITFPLGQAAQASVNSVGNSTTSTTTTQQPQPTNATVTSQGTTLRRYS